MRFVLVAVSLICAAPALVACVTGAQADCALVNGSWQCSGTASGPSH